MESKPVNGQWKAHDKVESYSPWFLDVGSCWTRALQTLIKIYCGIGSAGFEDTWLLACRNMLAGTPKHGPKQIVSAHSYSRASPTMSTPLGICCKPKQFDKVECDSIPA